MLAPALLAEAHASGAAPFGVFEVEASPGGRELTIEARFEPAAGETLEFEGGMGAFVTGAQLWTGEGWRDLTLSGDRLAAPVQS